MKQVKRFLIIGMVMCLCLTALTGCGIKESSFWRSITNVFDKSEIVFQATIAKAKAVFANMGADGVFGRSDIAAITKDSVTAAGNLITKLKNADLIEPVSGFGKGKYKFIAPKE